MTLGTKCEGQVMVKLHSGKQNIAMENSNFPWQIPSITVFFSMAMLVYRGVYINAWNLIAIHLQMFLLDDYS